MKNRGLNGTEQRKFEIAFKSMVLTLFLLYLAQVRISRIL
jgi:hypothetical protein